MTFRIGSIPVRVRAWFWVVAAVIASRFQDPKLMAIAAAIVFVSVLVHELGHALVGRSFGLAPQIELHMMGGTTSWMKGNNLGHLRQLAISAAGPFAGFLLAAGSYAYLGYVPGERHPFGADPRMFAFELAIVVNVYWGIINLLPLMPLDGGNMMRSVLMLITRDRGEKPARVISIVFAGALLLYAAVGSARPDYWLGAIAGMFVWMNVQAFKTADQRAVDGPLVFAIDKAYAALDKEDGATAVAALRPVLSPQASPELRQLALRLFAYGLLLQDEWGELLPLLDRERAIIGPEELARYAKTARELGKAEEADRIDAIAAQPSA